VDAITERKTRAVDWRLSAALVLAVVLLGGCGGSAATGPAPAPAAPQPVALQPGEKLKVIATTTIVADVVRQVGGDQMDLRTLMGTGAEAHSYTATPADAAAIYDADVLFASGAGLEEGLAKTFQEVGGSGRLAVQLSDGLPLIAAPAGGAAGQAAPQAGQGEVDPHTWFDVQNVIAWVDVVKRTLSALDPAHASVYGANASAYTQQLQALDGWIVEQAATLPESRRRLVTNHLAFEHFARRYGFEQIGAIYPISPSSEPSAQDLAALENAIRQHSVPAIFTESTVSPKLADQVAQDTGVRLVQLYTESVGPAGSGVESYIDLMRYNVNAIVSALK
jgi:manganese/iron transport system substrate-binding protein